MDSRRVDLAHHLCSIFEHAALFRCNAYARAYGSLVADLCTDGADDCS